MPYSYRSSKKSAGPRGFGGSRRPNTGRRSSGGRSRMGQYIDPSRFIQAARPIEADTYSPENKFTDFDLSPLLKKNLVAKGYDVPSPIQDQAIPAALTGKDIIGIASTGTGKTAAFALPVINRLLNETRSAALIIAPTRELAQQIEDECRALGKGAGFHGTLLIGGTNMGGQLRDLRSNPRIVIGTPGRIKDHLKRGTLNLSRFNMVVLDEVDRMLDMGFINDVTEILKQVSADRQSFFFSATMDRNVSNLIDTFSSDPFVVSLKPSATSENVHQDVVHYSDSTDKFSKLHDLLVADRSAKVIVFDETQRSVERLSNTLAERGLSVDALHGGKSQSQRQRALAKFKNNDVRILVATDVAARGIDVVDVTHVINYSIPREYDDYIHRIGRTGRAGRVGHALTFVAR